MTVEPSDVPVGGRPDLTRAILKRLLQLAAAVLLQGVVLFVAAGQTDWIMAWVYLGSYVALIALNAAILLPRNPDLIAERGRIKENTKGWDKILIIPMTFFGLGTLAVGGLDRRFEWTPRLGWTTPVTGLALYLLGFGLVSWAMASNRFFSSVVRIQKDRGHTVATGGPYGWIRHPGYLGMMVSVFGVALLLGSRWALIPAALYVATMAARTVLEDRTLRAELPGYPDYAERVRHRLVPGLW